MNNGATIQAQHNLAHAGDIAKTVLMPGDPARASYIARNYLTDAVLVNDLRLMYAYTGLYKGERITVMAHGMGAPSAAIYAHELYACYDVDTIIRIGTAGALTGDLPLGSMVAASGACYNTSYCSQFGLNGVFSAVGPPTTCSAALWKRRKATAPRVGRGWCSPATCTTASTAPATCAGQTWAFAPWKWKRRRCI